MSEPEKNGVEVMFTCDRCKLIKRRMTIRLRERNETLLHWMHEAVGDGVSLMHRILSPMCSARSVTLLVSYPKERKPGDGLGHLPA
jgi:hypothetical protein